MFGYAYAGLCAGACVGWFARAAWELTRRGGNGRRGASTYTNHATGTPTPGTVTWADFSSSLRRGDQRVEWATLQRRPRRIRRLLRGVSGSATADHGANGAPQQPAGSGDAA